MPSLVSGLPTVAISVAGCHSILNQQAPLLGNKQREKGKSSPLARTTVAIFGGVSPLSPLPVPIDTTNLCPLEESLEAYLCYLRGVTSLQEGL